MSKICTTRLIVTSLLVALGLTGATLTARAQD